MLRNLISATKLRHELTEVLAGLQDLEEPLIIIHRSHPIGILWSYERFQRLIEKLEDAEDLLTIYDRADETILTVVAPGLLEEEVICKSCYVL